MPGTSVVTPKRGPRCRRRILGPGWRLRCEARTLCKTQGQKRWREGKVIPIGQAGP